MAEHKLTAALKSIARYDPEAFDKLTDAAQRMQATAEANPVPDGPRKAGPLAWTWADVVADRRETGRSFVYVYRCPSCRDEQHIHAEDVTAHDERTGGNCTLCHTFGKVPDFWEVLQPIEDQTIDCRSGTGQGDIRVRLYHVGTRPNYGIYQAVVTTGDDRYITAQDAQPYGALMDAYGYVARLSVESLESGS